MSRWTVFAVGWVASSLLGALVEQNWTLARNIGIGLVIGLAVGIPKAVRLWREDEP